MIDQGPPPHAPVFDRRVIRHVVRWGFASGAGMMSSETMQTLESRDNLAALELKRLLVRYWHFNLV